jgi:hypothetical protein
MREEPSGRVPEYGQRAQEPWVARSNWVSEGLGEEWVEVEPGIYRQKEPDYPGPLARRAEAQSIEQTLRQASG